MIWRRQATPDSTEFVVSMLPLGGYVRMLDEREGPVAPAELGQAFNRKPLWARSAIVFAGPLANLGLAVLLVNLCIYGWLFRSRRRRAAPSPVLER